MKVYFVWGKRSALISALLMLCAAAVRCFAYLGGDYGIWFTLSQIILPFLTIFIFIVAAALRNLLISAVAVLLGVLFFIFKALTFDSLLHTILCIVLYLLVLSLYCLTVIGVIKTNIPLVLAFALPLGEHVVQDIIEIILGADINGCLPELSVLLIMGALLCVALGLKRKN
ncbi:MAG: hypothetical protein E7595_04485 [Ruminococcaceae bacterium]|nr:hypothetical protein [Oscillospiraceae bacterium]